MARIKVDPAAVRSAGTEMNVAATAAKETLSSVHSTSQAADETTFGDAATAAVFGTFWGRLSQQMQLSGDIFDELGKSMGGAADSITGSDNSSANTMNSSSSSNTGTVTGDGTTGNTTTSSPVTGTPGGDNSNTSVNSDPPPSNDNSGGDGGVIGGDGTVTSTTDTSTAGAQAGVSQS